MAYIPNYNFSKNQNFKMVPSIKFTAEVEVNKSLPFLDLLIERHDNNFKYKIYRKPARNLMYIHSYSSHHLTVKQFVFSSMYRRALRVVSPEYRDNELHNIDKIGTSLCYSKDFLLICKKKARQKFYVNSNRENTNTNATLVLPYYSCFESIISMLRVLKINIAFTFNCTIGKTLIKNSPKENSAVIYKVPCKTCHLFYIGETSKPLAERITNHKRSIRYAQTSNAIFLHTRDSSHPVDWQNTGPIIKCNDFMRRNLLESACIQVSYENNINTSKGLYNLDDVILSMFTRDLKNNVALKL